MGSIGRRLSRLEGGRRGVCGECGYDLGKAPETLEIVVVDSTKDNPPEDPEQCPECGRPVIINLTWEDSP